jgi:hypothetical protein
MQAYDFLCFLLCSEPVVEKFSDVCMKKVSIVLITLTLRMEAVGRKPFLLLRGVRTQKKTSDSFTLFFTYI